MPEQAEWKTVWMGTQDTAEEDGWFPVEENVSFRELSIFEGKVTFGAIDRDSDDIVSSWVISDLSGGGQIDRFTGADQSRFRHAILETEKPGSITLPMYYDTLKPDGATGTSYPAYQIGNYPYCIFGDKVYSWNETTNAWSSGVTLTNTTITGKPTAYAGKLFVPNGSSGYTIITDNGSGTPSQSVSAGHLAEGSARDATHSPTVVDFEVWAGRIWALTTLGALAFSYDGATNNWSWVPYWDDVAGTSLKLDTSRTPTRLVTFPDNNGDPALLIITDGAAYRPDETSQVYQPTSLQFPKHQDFGRAAAIFRPGEDLYLGIGLWATKYTTAGVVDPDVGLSRGDGMPFTNLGKVTDFEAEPSRLYATVSPATNTSVAYPYVAQFGSNGSGNSNFNDPRGLVVDSTGDIHIADTNNERVKRISSALAFEAHTSGSAGTGDSDFASNAGAYDVAVESDDDIIVVDKDNHRLTRFSASEAFEATIIDGRVSTNAFVLQATYGPTFNSLDLSSPGQVATDTSGNIYIADYGNNRLVKLNSSGAYVTSITGLSGITGVCVDSSNNVYVLYAAFTVRKYNSALTLQWTSTAFAPAGGHHITTDGTWVYYADTGTDSIKKISCSAGVAGTGWGSSGSTNGKFNHPFGICYVGSEIYVVDAGNNRVQVFNTSGTYQRQWVIVPGCRGIAPDLSSHLVVAEYSNNAFTHYTTTGTLYAATTQTNPEGITVTTGDVVWVSNATDGTIAKWDEGLILGPGTGNGKLQYPVSVDVKRSTGRIYVSDSGNHRVQYFDSAGAYVGKWGSLGSGNGRFGALGPGQLAVNQTTGDVYVLDPSNYRVQQFSATGTFIRAWGTHGNGTGQFNAPTAIDVHPVTQTVFVGDSTNDTIQEFSASGTYLRRFGSSGTGNGEFTSISGIAFNQTGTVLYVTDLADRIQSFTASSSAGSFLALPSVHFWNGQGWHGCFELQDSTVQLTWACITATTHTPDGYRLWVGATDGNVYSFPLRRTFHNPRTGWQAGIDRFASEGYLISSRFTALMDGFHKKASRLVVFADNASPTETITVSYRVDLEDDNWITLGTITETGRNILEFDVDDDGFSWGVQFNWIQFRFDFDRGTDAYQTPILGSAVLNYTKVPQQAQALQFTVPFPKTSWNGADGDEVRQRLRTLLRSEQYIKLVHQDTTYRGQLAAVTGAHVAGESTQGSAFVNFIEIGVDN